jgi:tripartite-type tricarboxylate transporter receptor subunit TctC
MTRQRHVAAVAVTALCLAASAQAQSWPSRPIKAIVPLGAGSANDVVPRAVFEPLSVELGQPIMVENRVGAGGTLGVGAVARANPDGYTILAHGSAHAIAPWIVPNVPYDAAKDIDGALI